VLIVGRLDSRERYKGHDQLLDAWPAVVARVPGARLTIVGEGDDAPRLKAKASALGLDGHVAFAGFLPLEGLDAAYRAASVFAMPSRGEGFGLAYVEAMSHALPCIGSTHDAASEVIVDGRTGFLVDQSDPAALTARIVQLLADSSLRTRMGVEAVRTVRERYTFDRFASRLESLIAERLEGPAAVRSGGAS
jgi:phosphatidylinositol alpha-1,6-mannosyltransferase